MENEEEVGDDHGGLLGHTNDDPFHGIPEVGGTDEQMLALRSDKKYLAEVRAKLGDSVTDEEFAAMNEAFVESLRATIAANDEEWENG
ncbi:MAG: hypothetical protein ACKOHN_01420 [Actinomycetota bacterium]